MPPVAKRAVEEDTATIAKRYRSAIDESSEELLCPITYCLPFDPVLAEDGKVYERGAIEDWLKQHQRSPVTNLPMGTKLVAATQIKNIIERMVRSGALPDDKIAEWKKRIEEQEMVAQTRALAEGGHARAAYRLGSWYWFGKFGLNKDESKAFVLFKQAADGGDADGMGWLANVYYVGIGVEKSNGLALRWAAVGSHLGSDTAMRVLGKLYIDGKAGLPVDKEEGLKWYKQGCEASADKQGCNVNAAGLRKLALMYAEGEGTTVDINEAAQWMRKAVKHNQPPYAVEKARAWLTARGLAVEVEE